MEKNNKKALNRRGKNYIPHKKHSPIQLGKKVENLNARISKIQEIEDAKYQALQNHISLVTNFAMHDIKNAIHNMDGFVYNMDSEQNKEEIKSLQECLNNMRQSLEDFEQLSLAQSKKQFTVSEFSASLRVLHSSTLNQAKIKFSFLHDDCGDLVIFQPFHALIQVLSNLIQNAVKAVKKSKTKQIDVLFYAKANYLYIEICDTGCGIKKEYSDKIFNMRFSKTGGSGIGLFHANWAVDQLNGNIRLTDNTVQEEYSTIFEIKIPIK
jgi:signal transduction histidine kinase